jgi:hypothetical protein
MSLRTKQRLAALDIGSGGYEMIRDTSWISGVVLFGLALVFPGRMLARQTSTPEERAQWVDVTHKLESGPLDDALNRQGETAFKQDSEAHDIHAALCSVLFNEFGGMKYSYSHLITRQYMLAIENPDKTGDTDAMNLSAVESVLKTYQSILQQKPDAKAKALDDMVKKQSQDKLKDFVHKQCH